MDTINQIELQNIRHDCGACKQLCEKINYYKTVITDQNCNQLLTKISNVCESLKQDLSNTL